MSNWSSIDRGASRTGRRFCALLCAGLACIAFWFGTPARAAADGVAPAPPQSLSAADHPNDIGKAIDLWWFLSPDDRPDRQPRFVKEYEVYRTKQDGSGRELVGKTPYGIDRFTDQKCVAGESYRYEVVALSVAGERSLPAAMAEPVTARRQLFDRSRIWFGAVVLLVCAAVVWYTQLAKTGRELYIRKIAGLAAIDEAVGRATEMGRPCLFIPGIQDMNDVATVAGISVLSRVAQTVAEYDATLVVPTARSLVMTTARETVQSACLAAGRPEAYDENSIYYVTDEQFAFVAHVTGYMVREKPAACFYAGTFYAESLILGETGNMVGALQIAATAEASQLPFFVAACDYTLIGEELFAASAYLSREPHQLGSLKGQDAGKLLAAAILVGGCACATLAAIAPGNTAAAALLSFVKDTVLGTGGGG